MTLARDPDIGTRLTAFAATDTGRTRTGNEDGYFRGQIVFAVADGMGGHAAGEIASAMALEPLQHIDGRTWMTAAQAERALVDAVRKANHDVVAKAASERTLRGMGTTLTAALVRDGRLHVAHVGDSRAYLHRPGEGLRQLTTDHTLVEQLVREGRLDRDDIHSHPQRSVITRAIGVEPTIDVDTVEAVELQPGDQVLLCSDGLTGPVGEAEIRAVLLETADGDEACTELIAAANREGGPDNITVLLLRVESAPPGELAGELPQRPEADGGPDTAELRPVPAEGPVRVINTRQESSRDFDASRFGAVGQRQGVQRVPGDETDEVPRRGRRLLAGLFGLLVLAVILVGGGSFLLSRSYFIGVDEEGLVAVYTGIPQDIAGLPLARVQETTDVRAADLPQFRRRALEQGITEPSLEEARSTVENLRRDAEAQQGGDPEPPTVESEEAPPAEPPPSVEPTPTPTPVPATPAPAAPAPTPTPPPPGQLAAPG